MRGIAVSRQEQVIPGIVRRLSGRGRRAFARRRVEMDDGPADDDAVSACLAGLSQDRSQWAAVRLRVRQGAGRKAGALGLIEPPLHRVAAEDEGRLHRVAREDWLSLVCSWPYLKSGGDDVFPEGRLRLRDVGAPATPSIHRP